MTRSPLDRKRWAVSCLVPDLPLAAGMGPYLRELDANRWYTNFGPLLRRYEIALAEFVRPRGATACPCAVAFSSATTALELALVAMDLPAGARILVPSLNFPAGVLAAMRAGLRPVLSDVDEEAWTLTPDQAKCMTRHMRIDAVMALAPFGYPVPLDEWSRFQKEMGIQVLVDAAGALGVQEVDGSLPVIFSLHATKPLGIGEGGVLITADAAMAEAARRLSNFGFQDREVRGPGMNGKMSEFHAAVGLAQLDRAPELLARRERVLEDYRALLPPHLFRPGTSPQGTAVTPPAVLPIHARGRAKAVIAELHHAGIETRQWYVPPLHRHAAFRSLERCDTRGAPRLEMVDYFAESLIGIPFHNHLDDDDIRLVCDSLLSALRRPEADACP